MDNTPEKPSFQWDDEKLAIAVRLREEGLSASEIAAQLGTTKGSILGKFRRIGLAISRGETPIIQYRRSRPAPPDRRAEKAAAALLRKKTKYLCLDIMALQSHHCRWIVADRPTLYCGHRKWGGSSYCPHHTSRAWRNFEGSET